MPAVPHVKHPRFILGAASPRQFPHWDLPEVTFGGRSNVGKSSLLRSLLGSRRLVRVSSRPGRTQEVNFFRLELEGRPCAFVDLPGYGYAEAPGRVQALWARTVEHYVSRRDNLALMVLLVDARRGPEAEEHAVIEAMDARRIPTLVVYTKIDQVSKNRRGHVLGRHQRALSHTARPLVFAAPTGQGRDVLLRKIASHLAQAHGARAPSRKGAQEAAYGASPRAPEQ